jgi:hypothetical protein
MGICVHISCFFLWTHDDAGVFCCFSTVSFVCFDVSFVSHISRHLLKYFWIVSLQRVNSNFRVLDTVFFNRKFSWVMFASCRNKVPQTGGFIVLWGVREKALGLSPGFRRWPAISGVCWMVEGSPISAFMSTQCSPLCASMSKCPLFRRTPSFWIRDPSRLWPHWSCIWNDPDFKMVTCKGVGTGTLTTEICHSTCGKITLRFPWFLNLHFYS